MKVLDSYYKLFGLVPLVYSLLKGRVPKIGYLCTRSVLYSCAGLLINSFPRHLQISAVSTRQVLEKWRYLRILRWYKVKTEHGRWIDVNLRKIICHSARCSGASFKLLVSSVSFSFQNRLLAKGVD